MREEVAVGLVLYLAERGDGRPQVRGATEKAERVGGEVEFGVGGDQAGRLGEGRQQRPQSCTEQTPFGQFVTPALSLVP